MTLHGIDTNGGIAPPRERLREGVVKKLIGCRHRSGRPDFWHTARCPATRTAHARLSPGAPGCHSRVKNLGVAFGGHRDRARHQGPLCELAEVCHEKTRLVGASSYHSPTRPDLAALHDGACAPSAQLAVALECDEMVGGKPFFKHNGIAIVDLSFRRARNRCASELLHDQARRCHKSRGLPPRRRQAWEQPLAVLGQRWLVAEPASVAQRARGGEPRAYRGAILQPDPEADPADLSATFPSSR